MVANPKFTGQSKSMPIGLALGWGISLGITILGSALLSMLILNGTINWKHSGYGVMVVLLLSSYVGASFAAGALKSRRLLVCMLSGVLYLFTMLGITALFFDGQYEAVSITSALIVGGSMCAALVHSAEKKNFRGTHKKRRL